MSIDRGKALVSGLLLGELPLEGRMMMTGMSDRYRGKALVSGCQVQLMMTTMSDEYR